MAKPVPQELFWEIVGEFVDTANELSETHSPDLVGTAMMYALSRYNTYVVARTAKDVDDFIEDRQKALDFFTERFQAMFLENFLDHSKNFEAYLNIQKPDTGTP